MAFNPEVSLLTANPNAQVHVFSGGALDGVLRSPREDAIENVLKTFLTPSEIEYVRDCTAAYTNMTNILCNADMFTDTWVENTYLLLSELKEDYPGFVPLQSGGGSRRRRHIRKYRKSTSSTQL